MSFIKEDYQLRGRVDFERCNMCPYRFKTINAGGTVDMADFYAHKASHLLEPTIMFKDQYSEGTDNATRSIEA